MALEAASSGSGAANKSKIRAPWTQYWAELKGVLSNDAKQTAWQNSKNSQKDNFLTTEPFRNRLVTSEADLHMCTSMHGNREMLGMDAQLIPSI